MTALIRIFGRGAVFVALMLCVSGGFAHAGDHPFDKWFKYSADIESAWVVEGNPADPLTVTVRPKNGTGLLKKVMVLYPRPSSAYDIAISTIFRVFTNKEINAEFKIVNFELNDQKGAAVIRDAEQNAFDLIFSMGSESTAWLDEKYRGGKLPVVTVCSKDPVELGQMPDYETGSGRNFAFTSLNVPVDVQMAYVRELRADLKNIAILVDSKNISAVQTQAEPIADYARAHGINVVWTSVQNPKKAAEELSTIVPDAVRTMRKTDPELKNSLFWLTGSTSVFREIRTINRHADRVPVVSVVPEIVAPGSETAVLAVGISFESNAKLAAIYGSQILGGKSAGKLKVGVVSPPDVAISFAKAREIGMRVPFNFFEIANFVYDYQGNPVRSVKNELPTN
ncbi:MAG TPA: ABC transporter substrate binding protein [Pseudolabrys sp.]|nr:ABC transporter substrate binding protein [Pseudolabrys sp.]